MNKIKVNQVYVAPAMAGLIVRRIRILAPHPDGGWIYEEKSVSKFAQPHIGTMRDFAIEKVFRLEQDVCEHKHTDDAYIDGGSNYPPSVPNYYKCTDCGDLFPNIGDTNLWFPKTLEVKVNG